MSPVPEWSDAFGKQIADGTRNEADLAAHYRLSPERYAFERNGSDVLLHYTDLATYDYIDDQRAGDEDVFVLQPDAGDTLQLRSAERFRYTVNYIEEVAVAVATNQALANPADRVTIGLDTGPDPGALTDGYFLEHLPTHAADECDLFERRNGTELGRQTVSTNRALTTFRRLKLDYNWYNVGKADWTETYTEGDVQKNEPLGTTTVDADTDGAGTGGRGPISGNGHLVVEVEADGATTDLELLCGSFGVVTKGRVDSIVRQTTDEMAGLSVGTAGEFQPLFGLRVNRDAHPNVTAQLIDIDITAGPEGKVTGVLCHPSKVLDGSGAQLSASDFSAPEAVPGSATALQVTDGATIAEFPDDTGTTVTSTTNPGGRSLMAFGSKRSTTGSAGSTYSSALTVKNSILADSILVLLAKPATTAEDYAVSFSATEEW